MKISVQIRMLCARLDISLAELARLTGQSPQNLNSKLKRDSFTIEDLDNIADSLNLKFERHFVLPNNEKI